MVKAHADLCYAGLGRNLALVEVRLVIAAMVWHFDFEQRFDEDWADQKVYMVWVKPPLNVKLRTAARQ